MIGRTGGKEDEENRQYRVMNVDNEEPKPK